MGVVATGGIRRRVRPPGRRSTGAAARPIAGRAYDVAKRGVDITVSLLGMIMLFPLVLLVAGLVRVNLGSPVIFRQARPGLQGEVFHLMKFRSMLPLDDEHPTDAERLTRFGRFLRASSLDELPSLLNVLRGDMTLVGPRPLLVEYLSRYTPEQARRHEVRPGITGLAQVAGRNGVPWERRLALDVHYVDTRSAAVDLRILVCTIALVVYRRGICEEGQATMREFTGKVPPVAPATGRRTPDPVRPEVLAPYDGVTANPTWAADVA